MPETNQVIQASAQPVSLALDLLVTDPRLQSRRMKPAVVKEYANALRRNAVFPPIEVIRDDRDTYYVVDGHHRVAATRQVNGLQSISAVIINGTFDDALWYSWSANREHGLQRTRDDKRRAIRGALQHPEWSKQSDRAIARHIGCDHKTVGAMRRYWAGEFPKRPAQSGRSARCGPSEATVLNACRTLVGVEPGRSYEFESSEVVILKQAYEALHRLVTCAQSQPTEQQHIAGGYQGGVHVSE